MQYNFRKSYQIGNQKGQFWDLAHNRLKLEHTLPYSNNTYVKDRRTCFRNLKIQKFRLSQQEHKFIQNTRLIKPNHGNWIKPIYNTIKQIIYKRWNPNKFHVISHSGGYDSRIISSCIKELYQEHGKDWLGDYIFVECAGEQPEFEAIMNHQGFENYISTGLDYYEYSFNPSNYKNRFSGYVSYPVNIWHDPFEWLEQKGTIPKDYQLITGFGAYSEKAVKDWTWAEFFKRNYFYQLGNFNFKDHISPFFDTDYFIQLSRYKALHKHSRRTSEIVCDTLLGMNHIQRPDSKTIHLRGVKKLPNHLFDRVVDFYVNSKYGKYKPQIMSNKIEYSNWWSHFNTACIIENL